MDFPILHTKNIFGHPIFGGFTSSTGGYQQKDAAVQSLGSCILKLLTPSMDVLRQWLNNIVKLRMDYVPQPISIDLPSTASEKQAPAPVQKRIIGVEANK